MFTFTKRVFAILLCDTAVVEACQVSRRATCMQQTSYRISIMFLSTVPAGVPAALAEKIYWVGKQLEERRGVNDNTAPARMFLEGTQVKDEVEKRMRMGDW